MRRHRAEQGFTLVELLMAMSLMVIMLTAALGTLEQFTVNSNANQVQNQAQDQARTTIDILARQLRNLSSPTPVQPQAVEKNDPYDLVFLSVNPVGPAIAPNGTNSRRIRYCLDASSPTNEVLWRQTQTWVSATPPPLPSTASCPDKLGGWNPDARVVATNIVNRSAGQNRPVWYYNSPTLATVSSIETDLYINAQPGKKPGETRLTTGIFLRNQNRPPTASLTAQATGNGHVLLNGSASADPENQALNYVWYDGPTKVGAGVTLDYVPCLPSQPCPGTSHTLQLRVFDPAGLEGDATQTVVVR